MCKKAIVYLLVSLLSTSVFSQRVKTQPTNNKVLASVGDVQYTQVHFTSAIQFLEFIVGAQISEEERQESLLKTIEKFKENPKQIIQEVEALNQQLQQLYQLTDVSQIALLRSAMISQIYAGSQYLAESEQPFIVKLMYKYVPLLAIDVDNMLAFTYKDFEGYIGILQFNAMMVGQNYTFTQEELIQAQNYLAQQFYYMSLQERQNLCSMQLSYEYMYSIYNSMTPEQKQQYQNQMLAQQMYQYQQYDNTDASFQQGYNQAQNTSYEVDWPEGVNTKAEKQAYLQQMQSNMNANNASMNIYYDTMMSNHATMLNTIENFGDTGVYWEYK